MNPYIPFFGLVSATRNFRDTKCSCHMNRDGGMDALWKLTFNCINYGAIIAENVVVGAGVIGGLAYLVSKVST